MTVAHVSSDGIFYTVQGEGPLIGVPSVFVRLDRCNLRCRWGETLCDASYTSWTPGGYDLHVDELWIRTLGILRENKCSNLVITGGEPLLQRKVVLRMTELAVQHRIHTTIETNGTIWAPCLAELICLSPKLKSSTPFGSKYEKMHAENRWDPEAIRQWMNSLTHNYYFKFVIDRDSDIDEVLTMLSEVDQKLPDPQHVVFMPQGITTEELWIRGRWVAEKCKQLGVRFSSRLQVDLYGNRAGT